MKKQITNRMLLHLSTKQGMANNNFAEACKDVRGLAIVTTLIEAEDIIQAEGDKFRKVLQREYGNQVNGDRLQEYFELLDKTIEIDLPQLEITTEAIEAINPTAETMKCLNLVRKAPEAK